MSDVSIELPDGSKKSFDHEPTVLEVAESIGPRLAKDTLGAYINGGKEIVDLRSKLANGTKIKIVTIKDEAASEVIRHSAAHVMAQAVQELWPDVKVTIGPVIENGFYYDFDSPRAFSPEDLEKIEKRMVEIIGRDLPLTREEWSSKEAVAVFDKMGEKFKRELIEDLKTPVVSIYRQGDWFDLCRGPHVQRTGQIKAVKVLSLAGAYWRGDEKRESLQRIYATAFASKEALAEHLKNLEEAKERDHRKLGRDLGLFFINPLSPGAPFFLPKGAIIYTELQNYLREKYREYGYHEVISPQIFDVELFHQSGHYDNYRENMYFSKIDDRDFAVKPMNCPGHCLIYQSQQHSYRDLPWRIADFGRLHRYERSGVMHGLTRVRSFAQDDAHVFCRMDQVQAEIENFIKFLTEVYKTLGLDDYKIFFSTRPEKRMGSEEVWDQAEAALENALKRMQLPYEINPGDGAFYGPKLDVMFRDALKRNWQLGTIQCDPNMPAAFKLKYAGEDNKDHQPVMLHRAILGSLERFMGVYLEHTNGRLPFWLAPEQIAILSLTDKQISYCRELAKTLGQESFRVRVDDRSEKLGYKIREAQLQRVPYILVIGDKEASVKTLSVRLSTGETINQLSQENFLTAIRAERRERRLKPSLAPQQT